MFKIGEFSRFSQVSIRMLRHYDKVGLLEPATIDPENGCRLYAAAQLSSAHKITKLRDMGFLIEDIKYLVAAEAEELLRELGMRARELMDEIDEGKRRIALLTGLKRSVELDYKELHYEVEIKSVPSFDAVSLRMIIPSYDDERLAWEKMGSYVKNNGIAVSEPYREFCEFRNEGDAAEGQVDIEIVVAVDEKRPDEDPFRFFRTEAFDRVASIMVYGPYENIAPIVSERSKI